ncbi:MAG: DUF3795 domain-containing protein [Spirochaetales bacterium]|nr:DUF3795 domain-containing protein [Spirochaetales bacterium]
MTEYKRKYPLFSLCGLNCGLCPRYQTDGISKCPGCGGADFHLKHPTCAVITCNKKHDNVEYCFQCSSYPCNRYSEPSKGDSFISYRNVISDFNRANKIGIDKYQMELNEKVNILEFLINNYNDGRKKSFYCIAVNLLNLSDLKSIMKQIDKRIKNQNIDIKNKIKLIIDLFKSEAKERDIALKLRKGV